MYLTQPTIRILVKLYYFSRFLRKCEVCTARLSSTTRSGNTDVGIVMIKLKFVDKKKKNMLVEKICYL